MIRTPIRFLFAGLLAATVLAAGKAESEEAPPNQPATLSMELKLPKTCTLTDEQIEAARRVQKAQTEMQKISEEMRPLYEDPKANADKLRALNHRLHAAKKTVHAGGGAEQKVQVMLVLTNHGEEDQTVLWKSDAMRLTLKLTGPGAVHMPFRGAVTEEFRMGLPTVIKAGATHPFKAGGLRHGYRQLDRWLITAPGTYTVEASLRTPSSMQGGGEEIKLHAKAVTLEVVKGEPGETPATTGSPSVSAALKVPPSYTLTSKEIEALAKAKDAAAEVEASEKERRKLLKDYAANKDQIRALNESMRGPQRMLRDVLDIKQDIPMEFVIANPTDKDVTLSYGGDASTFTLTVKGPGAINVPYRGPMTREFRMGRRMTIASGGTETIRLDGLHYGMRDMSRWLIAAPGKYTIQLGLKARGTPRGRGKPIQITAPPVVLNVLEE